MAFIVFLIGFGRSIKESLYDKIGRLELLKDGANLLLDQNSLMVGLIKGLTDDFFEKIALRMDFN